MLEYLAVGVFWFPHLIKRATVRGEATKLYLNSEAQFYLRFENCVQTTAVMPSPLPPDQSPLVVDLDGTLIKTDLL